MAFSTPYWLFLDPVTFQHLKDQVLLLHAAYVAAYLDDIIILSDNWAEHVRQASAVLEFLGRAGLTANPKKCGVGQRVTVFGVPLGNLGGASTDG